MTGRRLYHSSYSRYFVISSYLGHSTIKLPCLRILLMPRVPKGAWGEKLPAPPGLVDRPRALRLLPALILLSHFPSWRMLSWRGTAIVFAWNRKKVLGTRLCRAISTCVQRQPSWWSPARSAQELLLSARFLSGARQRKDLQVAGIETPTYIECCPQHDPQNSTSPSIKIMFGNRHSSPSRYY